MNAVLNDAVNWYVRLHDSSVSDSTRAQWQAWLMADPQHAQACARIEQLQQRLGKAPAGLASVTLEQARQQRRTAIKMLALLVGAGAVGWQGYRVSPLSADYATRVGERRQLTLADGSRLDLNTDTRVDIRFDATQRLIHLRQGELLISTAKDARPLSVQTTEGRILALGTRFSVRQVDGLTRVAVEDHAVEIQPSLASGTVRIDAGQTCDFSVDTVGPQQAAQAGSSGWAQGMLVAVDWRLDDLLAELSRYRHGYLGCAPEIAAVRVSGAFNLNDSETALASLQDALPVQVRRMTRYWVRIEQRAV